MDWDDIVEHKNFELCCEWARTFISQRPAIPAWVSTFRSGRPASKIVEELSGSFNRSCHIRFEDGVEWLVRFTMPGKVMHGDEKLQREVAAMRLVQDKTAIPVPKIHAWGLSNENILGLGPFIIMDFIQGVSLHHLWRQSSDSAVLRSDISETDLQTVYRQIAGFYLELLKLDFPQIGSLCIRNDQTIHADLTPLTLKMQEIEAHGGVKVGGNFPKTPSTEKFFEYVAEQDMEQLMEQANSVDDAEDARAKYKFHRQFHALIPRFINDDYEKMAPRLVCDDFRYGNMIVNNEKDLQIVAVIDWEWTYAAPYQMFCSAPRWLLIMPPVGWPSPTGAEFGRYNACLQVFLDELEHLENKNEALKELGCQNNGNGESLQQAEQMEIEDTQRERPTTLSAQMRISITDGTFWFHELMYDSYTNAENTAWRALCSLYPDFEEYIPVAEEELREFVDRKLKELEAYKAEWGAMKDSN